MSQAIEVLCQSSALIAIDLVSYTLYYTLMRRREMDQSQNKQNKNIYHVLYQLRFDHNCAICVI